MCKLLIVVLGGAGFTLTIHVVGFHPKITEAIVTRSYPRLLCTLGSYNQCFPQSRGVGSKQKVERPLAACEARTYLGGLGHAPPGKFCFFEVVC